MLGSPTVAGAYQALSNETGRLLQESLSTASALSQDSEIVNALFSRSPPNYEAGLRALLRPLLREEGELEGFELVLFATAATQRRSAAALLLPNAESTDGGFEKALESLAEVRLARVKPGPPPLTARDVIALYADGPNAAARTVTERLLCRSGEADCNLEKAVMAWKLSAQQEIDKYGLDQFAKVESDLDAALEPIAQKLNGEVLSSACPNQPTPATPLSNRPVRDLPLLIAQQTVTCASPRLADESTSLKAKQNLQVYQRILALDQCAHARISGGSQLSLDQAAQACITETQ
jgi:hypothetical protein